MESIGDRLKSARIDLHLSQDFVAKHVGLNRTAVTLIESGARKVSTDELVKFSELYGVATDILLNGTQNNLPSAVFARSFSSLAEEDQREILNLMEFKRMMKEQKGK